MNELTEKLDLVDMEDFLSIEGVTFRNTTGSSGAQLNVRDCPFCGGGNWKTYMNAESGLGNCFHGSCGMRFNKYGFIKALHGDDSRAAMREIDRYCRSLGWRPKRKRIRKETGMKCALPPVVEIEEGSEPYKYLIRRGFDIDLIDYFSWLYCEKGWWVYKGDDGQDHYQKYDGRIIIPVFDLEGNMVTFQGRDITGTQERKYLFPPGLPGTGRYLYNGHNVVGMKHLILAEGAFDVAAIKRAFDEVGNDTIGAIGSFGKSLSKGDRETGHDQYGALLRLFKRGLRIITIMWDGELQAKQDALTTALSLRGYGFDVYLAELPDDKDPNEVEPSVVRQMVGEALHVTLASATRMKIRWSSMPRSRSTR